MQVKTSQNRIAKIIYLSIGFFCLFIGILGLLLPVLPGWLFLIPAGFFLAKGSGRINRLISRNKFLQKIFAKKSKKEGK